MVGIGVENLGGAERRHLLGPDDFATEAPAEFRLFGEVRTDDFERDTRVVGRLSEVDAAHAALTEAPEQLVRSELDRIRRA